MENNVSYQFTCIYSWMGHISVYWGGFQSKRFVEERQLLFANSKDQIRSRRIYVRVTFLFFCIFLLFASFTWGRLISYIQYISIKSLLGNFQIQWANGQKFCLWRWNKVHKQRSQKLPSHCSNIKTINLVLWRYFMPDRNWPKYHNNVQKITLFTYTLFYLYDIILDKRSPLQWKT